jgi:PAS domain S-box-containing protein
VDGDREDLYRRLLETAPDAIVGVDADGRIVIVNAQTEAMFGYDRDELIGASIDVLVPERFREVHPVHRAVYGADPKSQRMGAGMQLAGRRRDGSEFPADISLSALETSDGLLVSAAIRDVSDRVEAQEARERQRAEAERQAFQNRLSELQRLESLGQLAGGIAHDFNNLLAAILNYAAFVAEEIEDAASEPGGERWATARRDIEQIQRAGQAAAGLTHQLLSFARREVIQPRPLDLNRVVANVEELLRRTIGEDIELLVSADPELGGILADPGQLEQVLVNVAVNARDAMPAGGVLTIETSNETVDVEYAGAHPGLAPGRYARVRVSDTGTGMDAETLQHAFEPFFTTKGPGEGTGLGLATVYGIVTQAGGYTHLYSEPGLGTTFSALLPICDDPAPDCDDPPGGEDSTGHETVLVVDDDARVREVAERLLTRSGYTVLVAPDGAEAQEIAQRYDGTIDVLVTDVIMPKILGRDLADRLVRARPEIGVLFMSGYAQPVLASRGTLDQGVTLLEKPFSEESLLAKVREVLDGKGAA